MPSSIYRATTSRRCAQVVTMLEETYCRTIGVEFRNIENTEERHWLQERMESTRNRLAAQPRATRCIC